MMQQINLYKPEKKKTKLDFTFRHTFLVFGGFFVIILSISAYDTFNYLTMKKELNVLGKEQLAKTEKLQVIAGKVPEEKTRNQIISEIKKYESERQSKENMLSLLLLTQSKRISGFSGYFESLAEESIPGLWLVDISFKDNGDTISLEGKANNAEYVPKLIAGLATHSIFKGKHFQLFQVSLDEETNQMDFILKTKVPEQP